MPHQPWGSWGPGQEKLSWKRHGLSGCWGLHGAGHWSEAWKGSMTESGIWPHTLGGFGFFTPCLFTSFYPLISFPYSLVWTKPSLWHHGDPSSRKDLLISSGKGNQEIASSSQLLQDLPQLQGIPLPKAMTTLGQSASGDWTWAGHLFQECKVLDSCFGTTQKGGIQSRAPHWVGLCCSLTSPSANPALTPSCHRHWFLINIVQKRLHLSICFWRTHPATISL